MGVQLYALVAALVICSSLHVVSALKINLINELDIKAYLENTTGGGYHVVLERNGVSENIAIIGRLAGVSTTVIVGSSVVVQFANSTRVSVTATQAPGSRRGFVITLSWDAPQTTRLEDCFYYGLKHWYGGPQQKRQYWPIERLNIKEYSYVTKEADNCGVAERYWLSSSGIFYFVHKSVPLFVDSNNIIKDAACFIAELKAPYSIKRAKNKLAYTIAIFEDVRKAHEFAIETFLKKPTGYPDELMIKYPIWSTWARYKTNISHDTVLQFADQITNYGFPNSQFELDDLWEICYGSLTVDERRFPSMKDTIDRLKSKGYRTTMWAHPFLNKGCEPWYTEAKNAGYLVASEDGNLDSSWWNNNGTNTSYVDFTKTEAREWYVGRLMKLRNETGVDAYKFDGGESSWSPQIPVLQGDIAEQPNIITSEYVRAVAVFGPLIEVRVGFRTQDLPIFVRMIDKDTYWTFENGLPTLITTMFQMNMNGYPLVLPDMIGGNGYNEEPSKELFIRWLQANTFMPSMQFSYVPWNYDEETIAISKHYVSLHAEYAPAVIEACKKAVSDGSPVNPPIWWISPNDTEAQRIWDEYLLGETILVAPVLEPNARSRDIYLPAGTWFDQGDSSKVIKGPTWIKNYPAPLNVLPYFVKQVETSPNYGVTLLSSVALVLLCLIAELL